MAKHCKGTTKKGQPCKRKPTGDTEFCPSHTAGNDVGGRPEIVLETHQIETIEKMAALGMDLKSICYVVGIAFNTLKAKMESFREVSEAVKRGKAMGLGNATKHLAQLMNKGNLGAIIFYLKSQHGWRENNRLEVTGPEGKPIQHSVEHEVVDKVLDDITPDKIHELIRSRAHISGKGVTGRNGHSRN